MMNNTTFTMDSWMIRNTVRKFKVAGFLHHICETAQVDAPYAEFWFENGSWYFLRILFILPPKGEETGQRIDNS